MPQKKKKTTKKEMSWDQIGKMIGKKIEKESQKTTVIPWKCWTWHHESKKGGNFFAAFVFAITGIWALGHMGYAMDVLPWWIKAILVLSFAFMFS